MRTLLLLASALLTAAPSAATTIVVPDSAVNIGTALAASAAGDTVLVQPGTYPELLVLVDGVKLLAVNPQNRPVLDGGGAGPVLTALACGPETLVSSFVIRNGSGPGLGGGALLMDSAVEIVDCRFESNSAVHGGGVGGDGGSFMLTNCEFEGNSAAQTGGAVSVTDLSAPVIQDCRFVGNAALAGGAVAARNACTPAISGSLFESNQADQGGAVWYDFFAGGSLQGCTLVFNDAGLGAGLFLSSFASPSITECILAFGVTGEATFAVGGASATYGCSNAFGNSAGDALAGGADLGTNFFTDPLFCDAGAGDYTLRDDSPCLPGPTCPAGVGAFGAGGCGPVSSGQSLQAASWGWVKGSYR